MPTATPRQIAEQRAHLANVTDAYRRLITGDLDWRTFAANPELAEAFAWKKVVEARDTLNAWTAETNTEPAVYYQIKPNDTLIFTVGGRDRRGVVTRATSSFMVVDLLDENGTYRIPHKDWGARNVRRVTAA